MRRLQLQQWLVEQFNIQQPNLKEMSGDAGFRRYFRFQRRSDSFIAVDSPSDKCNNQAFITVQKYLAAKNIQVPDILAVEKSLGFFCLSDFGDHLLADELTSENMVARYQQAIALLPQIASMSDDNLPRYDREYVQLELMIFIDWLIKKHLNISLTDNEIFNLEQCFTMLVDNAMAQPQVAMHRDFHSRNLMCLPNGELGVIDFQDAVVGPITYDVVSLLRDCYVKWPTAQVDDLFAGFCQLMTQQLALPEHSQEQWQRWFDLMGVQRHIKASGIFARLFHRDNKDGYLNDIPLTLSYIVDISKKYPELQTLHQLIKTQVLPAVIAKEKSQQPSQKVRN